jgi:glycosyltransferase involved in cell wall biosynthesis
MGDPPRRSRRSTVRRRRSPVFAPRTKLTRSNRIEYDPDVGVIAVVPDRWNGIWMPRHHVVGRLARRFPTVWIEPARNWRAEWFGTSTSDAEFQTIAAADFGLTLYEPGRWAPEFYRPRGFADRVRRRRIVRAFGMLKRKGCRRVVLYLWRPEFDWALGAVDADLTIYHIDDEYSFSMVDQPNDPREVRLIEAADIVFIHSRKLLEKKGGINPRTIHLPNGVDYSAFARPAATPADLARIPQPRLGYVGVVKSQLDFDLLFRLATNHPDWHFVLVGPIGSLGNKVASHERLLTRSNVHALGKRPLHELPGYVQGMNACLMCYDVNDYTHFIHPLKLNEYLATGNPIVASAIDAVAPLGHLISIARDDASWEALLTRALAPSARDPDVVRRRQEEAARHDWDVLVDRIADCIIDRSAHP